MQIELQEGARELRGPALVLELGAKALFLVDPRADVVDARDVVQVARAGPEGVGPQLAPAPLVTAVSRAEHGGRVGELGPGLLQQVPERGRVLWMDEIEQVLSLVPAGERLEHSLRSAQDPSVGVGLEGRCLAVGRPGPPTLLVGVRAPLRPRSLFHSHSDDAGAPIRAVGAAPGPASSDLPLVFTPTSSPVPARARDSLPPRALGPGGTTFGSPEGWRRSGGSTLGAR